MTTRSLQAAVQAIADEDRFALGAHPSLDHLDDHRAGRLPAAESERLQDHLARCSTCTELRLDLAAFPRLEPPAGVEPASDEEVEAAWRQMGPELLAAAPPPAIERARAPGPAERLRDYLTSLVASPRFAYGLAAVLLLALPLSHYLTRQQLVGPDFNVPIVNLVPERGPSREPAEPQALRMPADTDRFLLVLNLVTQRPYADYTVEIADAADGTETWRRDGLRPSAVGNFNLLVPRRFLPAGRYEITILGRDDETLEPVVDYRIRIEYE